MKKNHFLLLLATILFTGKAISQIQPCGADEKHRQLILSRPEIAQYEAEIERQFEEGLSKIDFSKAHKTTDSSGSSDSFWYDLPLVIHVIHDYGPENLSDDRLFNDLIEWNIVYGGGSHADSAAVIEPFKKWMGNPHIRLRLATKDRFGNPTKGITRHRSYVTNNATDAAKLDDWPNTSYINFWFVSSFQPLAGGVQPAAYAFYPATAEYIPFYDGVISLYAYDNYDKTMNHETGHCFNLIHIWGDNNNAAAGACADGGTDHVDDTPPTLGQFTCANTAPFCGAGHLYDTGCATGYYKLYPCVLCSGDSLVSYVDTDNVQNIMNYSGCAEMFTIGQVERMHQALNSNVASRNNLWSPTNLALTGALAPRPDLPPICAFTATDAVGPSVLNQSPAVKYFIGTNNHHYSVTDTNKSTPHLKFYNESWNDTISQVRWQFSNGATIPDITTAGVTASGIPDSLVISFSQPGWVSLTMTATDTTGRSIDRANNSTTTVFPNAVFVADSVGANANGYYQEFNPSGDWAKWPTFNYYDNEFKWSLNSTVGYDDNYCMSYLGFDSRLDPIHNIYPLTGPPNGDFDDMYSIPFDLSSYSDTDKCYLNFFYSGASRSSSPIDINDLFTISISVDGGTTWFPLDTMQKGKLENKGSVSSYYVPSSQADWSPRSINIPSSLRTNYTLFKFRYYPGEGSNGATPNGLSSGNNFYIDRISFNKWTAEVSDVKANDMEVVVAPNPTQGNAYVIMNNKYATSANIIVTDITGKVVYNIDQQLTGTEARIEIPKSAIAAKGFYFIQTITGNSSNTNKLVVY